VIDGVSGRRRGEETGSGRGRDLSDYPAAFVEWGGDGWPKGGDQSHGDPVFGSHVQLTKATDPPSSSPTPTTPATQRVPPARTVNRWDAGGWTERAALFLNGTAHGKIRSLAPVESGDK
jgi:hypothetical protein